MPAYYIDIETTGREEIDHRIITIQYQELARYTGKPGDLTILKEWDMGESDMLQKFITDLHVDSTRAFDFIPVGFNLCFENKFLSAKAKKYKMPDINLILGPHIDLHQIAILINNGEFKNSGLDKMTGKERDGSVIPNWYETKQYDKIEKYIVDEAKEFVNWYQLLLQKMPLFRNQLTHT